MIIGLGLCSCSLHNSCQPGHHDICWFVKTANLDRTKKSRQSWGESTELNRASDYTVGISTLLAMCAHHTSMVPRGGNLDRRVVTCCSKCPALNEALSQSLSSQLFSVILNCMNQDNHLTSVLLFLS